MPGDARIDELVSRWEELRSRGEEASVEDLCRDDPDMLSTLRLLIARRGGVSAGEATEGMLGPKADATGETVDASRFLETEGLTDCLGPPQGPEESGRL